MNAINRKLNIMAKIIEVLMDNQGADGLSRISQKDIASKIDRSPSCVSKTIRKLEKHDKCIERIAPSVYKVNHKDVINYGPFPKVKEYVKAIEKDPEIIMKTFKEQSELINMSIEDIQMVQGYIYGAFGKPK